MFEGFGGAANQPSTSMVTVVKYAQFVELVWLPKFAAEVRRRKSASYLGTLRCFGVCVFGHDSRVGSLVKLADHNAVKAGQFFHGLSRNIQETFDVGCSSKAVLHS